MRIHELCAVLELYLIEMRRVEDKYGYPDVSPRRDFEPPPVPVECRAGACGHYPRLVLDLTSASPPRVGPGMATTVFYITRREILRHSKLPGSATDRFDHPIFFARAGYPLPDEDVGEEGQRRILKLLFGDTEWDDDIEERFGPNHTSDVDWHGPVAEPVDDAAAGLSDPAEEDATPDLVDEAAYAYLRDASRDELVSEALPSIESLGGLLALARGLLARGLLALTPRVSNLSLTGMFHRLLCGSASIELEGLRHLSIGPLLPYWQKTFNASAITNFHSLEQLRICAGDLNDAEIGVLAGDSEALPQLRRVQWEVVNADDSTARSVSL